MKCENGCDDRAEVSFQYLTSAGPIKLCLCGVCAVAWWNKYKHTPAGETLIIEDAIGK